MMHSTSPLRDPVRRGGGAGPGQVGPHRAAPPADMGPHCKGTPVDMLLFNFTPSQSWAPKQRTSLYRDSPPQAPAHIHGTSLYRDTLNIFKLFQLISYCTGTPNIGSHWKGTLGPAPPHPQHGTSPSMFKFVQPGTPAHCPLPKEIDLIALGPPGPGPTSHGTLLYRVPHSPDIGSHCTGIPTPQTWDLTVQGPQPPSPDMGSHCTGSPPFPPTCSNKPRTVGKRAVCIILQYFLVVSLYLKLQSLTRDVT